MLLMLELERYRRPKVPRSERMCSGKVKEGIHFGLRCPALVNARKPLIEKSTFAKLTFNDQ